MYANEHQLQLFRITIGSFVERDLQFEASYATSLPSSRTEEIRHQICRCVYAYMSRCVYGYRVANVALCVAHETSNMYGYRVANVAYMSRCVYAYMSRCVYGYRVANVAYVRIQGSLCRG